jgi:hypothetical protein
MRTVALTLAAVLIGTTAAQEAPKPGPEHKHLAKLEGTWETTMKFGDNEHKGTMTYKMELGGLWLTGSLQSNTENEKEKFYGRSMETYDSKKKKYVTHWFDSMSTTPMAMEGSYDKENKTMTMTGDSVGMDGKPAKWKWVTKTKDDDTMVMSAYVGDGKNPMFTVTYKRKKK